MDCYDRHTESAALTKLTCGCPEHPFFEGVDFENHMQAALPAAKFQDTALLRFVSELNTAERARDPELPLAFESDKLQARISSLASEERSLLMHLLRRKQILHLPGPCLVALDL